MRMEKDLIGHTGAHLVMVHAGIHGAYMRQVETDEDAHKLADALGIRQYLLVSAGGFPNTHLRVREVST